MLIDEEERMSNIVKAMIALLNLIDNEDIKLALLVTKYNLEIPILRTYKKAINNLNYGQ
jgi:hypothetical protein